MQVHITECFYYFASKTYNVDIRQCKQTVSHHKLRDAKLTENTSSNRDKTTCHHNVTGTACPGVS
jgi:hypothetical protein